MNTVYSSLSENIVRFCRFLRMHQFNVSAAEEIDALRAFHLIDLGVPSEFRDALKTVLCKNGTDWNRYDLLYHQFWKIPGDEVERKTSQKKGLKRNYLNSLQSLPDNNDDNKPEETAAYSMQQQFKLRDFSQVTADELDEYRRAVRQLAARVASAVKRRYKFSYRRNIPDIRKSLRKNMRYGGELWQIVYRKPIHDKTRIVILCDVSKSMELYSDFFLQFMFAFHNVYKRMNAFSFDTELQDITNPIQQSRFAEAMERLNNRKYTWGSGTRIGECLTAFVKKYSDRLLNKHTLVLILSDGWDTGNTDLVSSAMKTMHEKCRKIYWINPLAGYSYFRPEVAALKAALPYIDSLLPVYNLDTLKKLGRIF